jgi:hypothetical protein
MVVSVWLTSIDCKVYILLLCRSNGYVHDKMNQTKLLFPFQKGKDLKLEIEMACNHCTK